MMTTSYSEGSIRAAVQTANHIRNRHADIRSGIRTNHDMAINFARSLQEIALDDLNDPALEEELKVFMLEQKLRLVKAAEQNVTLDRKIDAFEMALSAVTTALQRNHEEQDYETLVASEIEKATSQLPAVDLQQAPRVRELQIALDLPTLCDNEEDELQVLASNSTQNLKCPISAAIFEDPVRNKVCKHVYSRNALVQFLAQAKRKRNCACPVFGCSNQNLTLESCEPDQTTAMSVKRHERKQAHQLELRMSQAANVDSDGEAEFE